MMWTAIQLLTCVTIILAVSFFVGKRIGQRRYIKMQEEMKALEKAFNQLLEQMELVSGHNLQVLDGKTQDLRELLNVVDKKCLYATDLMKEVDEMKRRLQNHNRTPDPSAAPAPVSEIKLRREIQDILAETNGRIETIVSNIHKLEQDQEELFQQLLTVKKSALATDRSFREHLETSVLQTESSAPEAPANAFRLENPAAAASLEADEAPPELPPLPVEVPQAPENLPLDPSPVIDRIRQKSRPAVSTLDPMQYEIVRQVLDLYEQGVSIPQIARQMKMSKTEVELMMKFYDMRKAV